MAEELKIKDLKQVVCNGFITYTQEIVELASQGYILDVSNKHCPQWQLGLFTATMLLLDDEVSTVVVEDTTQEQQGVTPKRVYTKSNKAKEALRSKLPAEALQTITKD